MQEKSDLTQLRLEEINCPFPEKEIFEETCKKVVNMTYDNKAKEYANLYGLCISDVSWEDCARNKNSAW